MRRNESVLRTSVGAHNAELVMSSGHVTWQLGHVHNPVMMLADAFMRELLHYWFGQNDCRVCLCRQWLYMTGDWGAIWPVTLL
jgi:hypothetical protein